MESPEAFEAFLLWLGRDQVAGGRKYEEVRQKLIALFRYRGCPNPEELADETLDRTARAVLKPDFTYVGDPIAYFHGVARNVHYEWLRRQRKFVQDSISEAQPELPSPEIHSEEVEIRSTCLERCLDTLPEGKKTFLLRYYGSEKRAKIDGRQLLAKEEGIALNALRIQVFRLRNTLRNCVGKCLEKDDMQLPRRSSYS
jgi:DNA-directed RNA polymerase specialized sigma24 family protein